MPEQSSNHSPLKIRIAIGKTVAMGPGKADLLDAIDETVAANSQSQDAKHSAIVLSIDSIQGALEAIETDLRMMDDTSGGASNAA